MKRVLPYPILLLFFILSFSSNAQVTKLYNQDVSSWVQLTLANRLVFLSANSGFWSTDGTGPLEQYSSGITLINYFWITYNGRVYFYGSSPAGTGIYVTDGTEAGTQLVTTKINTARNPTICNGLMFFEDGGYQLWETDGTDAGTKMVKYFANGLPVDNYSYALNNTLYFTVVGQPDSSELWKTDGTESGTVFIKSIASTANRYQLYCLSFSSFIDGKLLFWGSNGGDTWITDGTPAGTQKAQVNLYGANHLLYNNKYYITDTSPTAINSTALFTTDGTTAGTVLIQDSVYMPLNSNVSLNNKLISPIANWLYSFDVTQQRIQGIGTFYNFVTNTPRLRYANNLPISIFDNGYNTYQNNKVFFIADDSIHGQELWQTDGTSANTNMVKDINPGPGGAFDMLGPYINGWQLILIDTSYCYVPSGIYFAANDSIHGMELWQSDGTTGGTRLVKDINPGGDDSYPVLLGTANNHVFFTAFDSGNANYGNDIRRLFVIDATNATLPVSLINFDATPVKENVLVSWATTAEVNTSYFNVQRSTDAISFENVGKVAAANNSTAKINYQFTDVNALTLDAQFLYYRLQINDNNGIAHYSNVVRIPVKNISQFKVYPNPAKNLISINYNLQAGENASLRVTDINGKTVLMQTVNSNTNNLDVSALSAGVYYIQVITKTGVRTDKFVKE